jgi:hypothetical protein
MLSISNAKLILLILNLAFITPNVDGVDNQEHASQDQSKVHLLLASEIPSCTLPLDLSGTQQEQEILILDPSTIKECHNFTLIEHLIILMMLPCISHTIKK